MVNWKSNIRIFLSLFLVLSTLNMLGQDTYKTDTGVTIFDAAKSSLEPIHAKNSKTKVVFRASDGALVALLSISDFIFPNSLMQEHFNENYMETSEYPTASFKAEIKDFDSSTGQKEYSAKGVFKIHGVEKSIEVPVKFIKNGEDFKVTSKFKIILKDFKIKIPTLMYYKIAEDVEISIDADLKKS